MTRNKTQYFMFEDQRDKMCYDKSGALFIERKSVQEEKLVIIKGWHLEEGMDTV